MSQTQHEEWGVRHAQGTHPGPFTEEQARRWIAEDIKRDVFRQSQVQGMQRLLRRYVTDWEEVPLVADCEAKQYDRRDCDSEPKLMVRYLTKDRSRVLDQHPACFRHGLAEVDRHDKSGGISVCEMIEP